jgi:hypothetical protein
MVAATACAHSALLHGWSAWGQHLALASSGSLSPGCGTDTNGNPTDNRRCGAPGTNAYAGENAMDLTSWCGGRLPGDCKVIRSCNPELSAGKPNSHRKYYLFSDLNCGLSSLALVPQRYADVNLNGHTITGGIFLNGGLRGFHFFNGTLNCSIRGAQLIAPADYAYACLDNENNAGTYATSVKGGDQIRVHHISGQNSYGCAFFMRFTGKINAPAGGWTEPAIVAYNNTYQSVPVTVSCNREHAGIYSETQPIDYYNNRGDVGSNGDANAAQLLEVYGNGGQDPFPNYVHNNYLTCEPFSITNGDTCRPILCDGAHYCHIQYNDIWPSNNRGTRLRDAFNAEVDHNYYHELSAANAFRGACWHTGDNDIGSGIGQTLSQNIHNNICELGTRTVGIHVTGQQGVTLESNTFLCAAGGCDNVILNETGTGSGSFPGGIVVDATAKTFTCARCSFTSGGAIKPGSVLAFDGFKNVANDNVYTVTAITPRIITVSDPNNQLVSEISTAGAKYGGVSQSNMYNSVVGPGLVPHVVIYAISNTQPATATIQYCGQPPPTLTGNGTLTFIKPPCS